VTKTSSTSTNKPAYGRVLFLHRAALLLTQQSNLPPLPGVSSTKDDGDAHKGKEHLSSEALARRLVSDLQSVSRKTQIRLPQALKHSICKLCNTMLVPSLTCSEKMENRSKNGSKPWADVKVQSCNTCGSAKRIPVGAQRQLRRAHRGKGSVAETDIATEDTETGG
jgi:ribonuclease P protein subunit RPR2